MLYLNVINNINSYIHVLTNIQSHNAENPKMRMMIEMMQRQDREIRELCRRLSRSRSRSRGRSWR